MAARHSGPNRRQVLGGLAAVSLVTPAIAQKMRPLVAAQATAQLAPDGYAPTPVWAFDGTIPGPVLRGKQGERMRLAVQNDLPLATSVHWHGIRLDNAMDGVPGLTQDPILPGAAFDYDLRLPDAGTFWYHSHERSFEQVARGLAGPLIIEETDPPEVDDDIVLMFDDWRFLEDATLSDDFGALFDAAHGGRIGNWVTVNGTGEFRQALPRGARVRLRLINSANARIFDLSFQGMTAHLVALDGMPTGLARTTDVVTLAPAQRVDLIVDITGEDGGEALILSRERDGRYAVVAFPIEAGATPRTDAPEGLPLNPVPLPETSAVQAAPLRPLRMEGGAMGSLASARFEGESLGARNLAAKGMVWAFNGTAGMPEAPFAEVSRGEVVRINLINETAWPHGMHLHGHHFLAYPQEGAAGWVRYPALRDTILVAPQSSTEIAFIADNPGDWLLHCHMLEHAHSGMMTWIRVS